MSATGWVLGTVLAALASAAAGVAWGVAEGRADAKAAQDSRAVQDLTALIDANSGLVKQAAAASREMRRAMAARGAADDKTTKELRDALASTADSRAGCVFPADVMRQLATARDRAAQAAAGGVLGALPGPAASAAGQR